MLEIDAAKLWLVDSLAVPLRELVTGCETEEDCDGTLVSADTERSREAERVHVRESDCVKGQTVCVRDKKSDCVVEALVEEKDANPETERVAMDCVATFVTEPEGSRLLVSRTVPDAELWWVADAVGVGGEGVGVGVGGGVTVIVSDIIPVILPDIER